MENNNWQGLYILGVQLNIRFYNDPVTSLPHIYRHDVIEIEAEEILNRPVEDRPGKDGSQIAVGMTQAGRYLRVIYVRDADQENVFVITAY